MTHSLNCKRTQAREHHGRSRLDHAEVEWTLWNFLEGFSVSLKMRVLFTVALLLLQLAAALSDGPSIPRPDHTEHARLARWIAHYNTWGTLSLQGQQSAI